VPNIRTERRTDRQTDVLTVASIWLCTASYADGKHDHFDGPEPAGCSISIHVYNVFISIHVYNVFFQFLFVVILFFVATVLTVVVVMVVCVYTPCFIKNCTLLFLCIENKPLTVEL